MSKGIPKQRFPSLGCTVLLFSFRMTIDDINVEAETVILTGTGKLNVNCCEASCFVLCCCSTSRGAILPFLVFAEALHSNVTASCHPTQAYVYLQTSTSNRPKR